MTSLPVLPQCKCGAPGREPHACPYAEDVHNDDTPCTCCDDCMQECCDDI